MLFFKVKGDIKCALIAVKGVGITDLIVMIFFGRNFHSDAFSIDGDDEFIVIGTFSMAVDIFIFDDGFTFDGGLCVKQVIQVESRKHKNRSKEYGETQRESDDSEDFVFMTKEHNGNDCTYDDAESGGNDDQRCFIIGKSIIFSCKQIHKGGTQNYHKYVKDGDVPFFSDKAKNDVDGDHQGNRNKT